MVLLHLLAGSLLVLRCGLLPLHAVELLVRAGLFQRLVRGLLLLRAGDGARLDAQLRLRDGDDLLQGVLRHVLQLRTRGVALLHALRARALWEDLQLGHVQLQPLHILLQALRAAVLAAVVHGDADREREPLGDLGLLELREREALAQAQLHVVPLRWGVHDRPQESPDRAGRDGGRLLLPREAAALLPARLVEPGPEAELLLPLVAALLEVDVGDDVVSLLRHLREVLVERAGLVAGGRGRRGRGKAWSRRWLE